MKYRIQSKQAGGGAAIAGAVGAGAVGAFAIGALAIGALVVRKLLVGRATFKSVHIEDFTVNWLRVSELIVDDRR